MYLIELNSIISMLYLSLKNQPEEEAKVSAAAEFLF
jgi:hypothetical protein